MAGAPLGNNNAGNGQQARQALEIAVRRISTGEKNPVIERMEALVKIWEKAIEKATEDGDMQALNAIMDRLDGKPGQAINIGGQADSPLAITEIKHTVVDTRPRDTESIPATNEASTI